MRALLLIFSLFALFVGNLFSYSVNKFETLQRDKLIKYYVYTRENINQGEVVAPDVESVIRNVFDPLKPVTISIPDWAGIWNTPGHEIIVSTKLKVEDCNVITVDWQDLKLRSYEEAVENAQSIGASIANFIILLHKDFDIALKNVHLVGFSLGAHIAGFAGQAIQKELGYKIDQITGLDPAALLFSNASDDKEHLTFDDAHFVEVIHTNSGVLGYKNPCGHADYYPNGGIVQSGCAENDNNCSHWRAYELIKEMWIPNENEFLSTKCKSIEQMNLDVCSWVNIKMGQSKQLGIFYLETRNTYPFGKGSFVNAFL